VAGEMDISRSGVDRRSGRNRRRAYHLGYFKKGRLERRYNKERRSKFERREGWIRISKWQGAFLESLKIAKFL
jgi:hypothetical protein